MSTCEHTPIADSEHDSAFEPFPSRSHWDALSISFEERLGFPVVPLFSSPHAHGVKSKFVYVDETISPKKCTMYSRDVH